MCDRSGGSSNHLASSHPAMAVWPGAIEAPTRITFE